MTIITDTEAYDQVAFEDDTYGLDPSLVKELRDMIMDKNDGKISKSELRLRQLALDLSQQLDQMPRCPTDQTGQASTVVMISSALALGYSAALRAAARATD